MLKHAFLLVSLLLICLVGLGVSAAQADPVGTFLQVEGRVDLLKGGKLPATEVKVQDPVEVGDVVRTKSLSRAQIKFVDATVLTIAPESRVTIEEYMFDEAKGERQAVLGVLRGLVHTAVEKIYPTPEPDFIIKTHTAVLGVRGTRWYTKLLPTATDVYTEGSKLEVKSIFPEIPGVQTMKDLQYVQVGWFMPPTMAMNITKQDLMPLEQQMKFGVGASGETDPGPDQLAKRPKVPLAPKYAGEPNLIENLGSGAYVPPRIASPPYIAPPPPPAPPPCPKPKPKPHNGNNSFNNGNGE
jgi:hypothetical protein